MARSLKKGMSAEHIGLDKRSGILYAAVHMAFRREVHHEVRVDFVHHAVYCLHVADIPFYESHVWQRKLVFN